MDTSIIYTYTDIFNEVLKIGLAATKDSKKTKMHEKLIFLSKEFIKLRKGKTPITDIQESDIHKEFELQSGGKFRRRDNESGFRFRRKDVFLTYSDAKNNPNINTLLEELTHLGKYDKNMEKVGYNMKEIFIVREFHQNGVAHFHVYIQFFEAIDTTNPSFLDIPSLKHPEIRLVYNKRKVLSYMAKKLKNEEDWKNNSLQYQMDINYYLETVAYHLPQLAYDLMKKNITVEEAVQKSPTLFFKMSSVEYNYNLYHTRIAEKNLPEKKMNEVTIFDHKFKFDGNLKCPQFWICGNTDSGKTTRINNLEKEGYRGYMGSKENDWSGYKDDNYDFMYFEEYQNELTIRQMNQLLEGSKMDLRAKYGYKILKKKNVPIFINSNYFPHETYTKVDTNKLNLLYRRIYIIYVDMNHKSHIIWDPSKDKIKDFNWNLTCMDDNKMYQYLKGTLPNISFEDMRFNQKLYPN